MVDGSDNRRTGRIPRKFFRCGSENHPISKFPQQPKDNDKRKKEVHFNEKGNRACDSSKNNIYQRIYASMARMSVNENYPSEKFGDISQLTNWILDCGAMCHITPKVAYFITGSLKDTE